MANNKITAHENIGISEEVTMESREMMELWSWHVVEIELEDYKKDGNKRHLLVAAVMAIVALETFLNNIVEHYGNREQFEEYDSESSYKNRIKKAVDILGDGLKVGNFRSWDGLLKCLSLRSRIVHKRTKSEIRKSDSNTEDSFIQENPYRIDWEGAEEKIMAVKDFVRELHSKLKEDSDAPKGHKEWLDCFFSFIDSKEEIEKRLENYSDLGTPNKNG